MKIVRYIEARPVSQAVLVYGVAFDFQLCFRSESNVDCTIEEL
jgi:hypothetical protein